MSEPVPIGSLPPAGEVPKKMFAQVIRQDRFGDPCPAFQVEQVDVPEIKAHEVVVHHGHWNPEGPWVRQKRLQGSPGTNDEQAAAYNQLVCDAKIDPCLGEVYAFEDIGQAHADMEEGKVVFGNRVTLVGAPEKGVGRKKAQRGAAR